MKYLLGMLLCSTLYRRVFLDFRYSLFRQDYLRNDLPNDPKIDAMLNEDQRKDLLKSVSTGTMSRATNVKNQDYEREAIQTIGYVPLDISAPSLISKTCFTDRIQKKYADFPLNSFYLNQSYLYDYHVKQQIRNNQISRVHSTAYFFIKRTLLNVLLKALGDRSEMAHSVEGRTPFLDHHLVDYVNHLPTSVKLKLINGKLIEKYILKEVARPFITPEVYQREKHPFLAPPTFLDRKLKIYQYMQDTFHSQEMKDLDCLFNIEQIRKNLDQLQRRQEQMDKPLQLRELVALEGFYLMLCSYVTLKKRFNVKYEG